MLNDKTNLGDLKSHTAQASAVESSTYLSTSLKNTLSYFLISFHQNLFQTHEQREPEGVFKPYSSLKAALFSVFLCL